MQLRLQRINEEPAPLLRGCSRDSAEEKHPGLYRENSPLESLQKLGIVPVLGQTEGQQRIGAGNSLEVELGIPDLGAFSPNWAEFRVGTPKLPNPAQ